MIDNTDHMDWLNDYPELGKHSRNNPFAVPQNYFEDQQERIKEAIFTEELKQNIPSGGFNIPENYFDDLQQRIFSMVELEKIRKPDALPENKVDFFEEQQSIIIARIKINQAADTGSGFIVPEKYFETLSDQILQKVTVKEAIKPVKLRSIFAKGLWKYATAASIAIAVVAGFVVKQYEAAHNVQTQLSNLPDTDIENYLKIHADSYDNHLILENSTDDVGLETIDQNISSKNSDSTIN